MIKVVEEAFYISLNHITKTAKLQPYDKIIRRLSGASSRTITIAERVEVLFVYRTQYL